MKLHTRNHDIAPVLIRIGLAFVFLYAAISSLVHPLLWIGYLPGLLTKTLGSETAIQAVAIYEIVLAVWLLSGKYKKYAAALSALTFAGIILANLGQLLITFRDVGLLFAAAALFFLED